jgi:signal peptidase I
MEQTTHSTEGADAPRPKSTWKSTVEFLRFAIIVITAVILFRAFIAQPFVVAGNSMVPTFQNANYLIIDELTYHFSQPARGDVIVFHPPTDMSTYYIKRVIGIPGDTIKIDDGIVTIINKNHPNGIALTEPYINQDTTVVHSETVVPDGMYFVMGDNRGVSFDSRRWGLLPRKNITGRAFLRIFPLKELSVFPGAHTYSEAQ